MIIMAFLMDGKQKCFSKSECEETEIPSDVFNDNSDTALKDNEFISDGRQIIH